jgi:nucleotide-binding universal stress UspA family protein
VRGAIAASVVVGTNGSAAGHDAVEWAATEAAARLRGLTIVHAEPELVRSHQRRTSGHSVLQENADPLLEEAVRRARVVAPDVPIRARDIVGGAIPALLGQQPEMIVVGDRGRRSWSWSTTPASQVRTTSVEDCDPQPGQRGGRRPHGELHDDAPGGPAT